MKKHKQFSLALMVSAALGVTLSAQGMAGTANIAGPGKPVTEKSGWPEGALALINDPLRTDGWNPWFSELPNDITYYEYNVANTADVNRLIQTLATIKSTNAAVRLNAGKRAAAIGFGVKTTEKNRVAVVLSLGNQKRLDEWYQPLAKVSPGVRGFGAWRYPNAPVALPPTLTIYAGHEAVDLNALKIPENVQVISEVQLGEKNSMETTRAIETFMAKRKVGKRSRPAARTADDSQRELSEWVERCLKDFAGIKPGMTRDEVEKKFNLDGGLQGASPGRFAHPASPHFKVDVEFDHQRNAADQGRAITSKDDKVLRVSKPYLERPFAD